MNDEARKREYYRMLLECFRSEQMSADQLLEHMAEDSGFKAFVEREIGQIRSADILNTLSTRAKK